eukprot:3472406-Pyramimonas_sp.AAC.1
MPAHSAPLALTLEPQAVRCLLFATCACGGAAGRPWALFLVDIIAGYYYFWMITVVDIISGYYYYRGYDWWILFLLDIISGGGDRYVLWTAIGCGRKISAAPTALDYAASGAPSGITQIGLEGSRREINMKRRGVGEGQEEEEEEEGTNHIPLA